MEFSVCNWISWLPPFFECKIDDFSHFTVHNAEFPWVGWVFVYFSNVHTEFRHRMRWLPCVLSVSRAADCPGTCGVCSVKTWISWTGHFHLMFSRSENLTHCISSKFRFWMRESLFGCPYACTSSKCWEVEGHPAAAALNRLKYMDAAIQLLHIFSIKIKYMPRHAVPCSLERKGTWPHPGAISIFIPHASESASVLGALQFGVANGVKVNNLPHGDPVLF